MTGIHGLPPSVRYWLLTLISMPAGFDPPILRCPDVGGTAGAERSALSPGLGSGIAAETIFEFDAVPALCPHEMSPNRMMNNGADRAIFIAVDGIAPEASR